MLFCSFDQSLTDDGVDCRAVYWQESGDTIRIMLQIQYILQYCYKQLPTYGEQL